MVLRGTGETPSFPSGTFDYTGFRGSFRGISNQSINGVVCVQSHSASRGDIDHYWIR